MQPPLRDYRIDVALAKKRLELSYRPGPAEPIAVFLDDQSAGMAPGGRNTSGWGTGIRPRMREVPVDRHWATIRMSKGTT